MKREIKMKIKEGTSWIWIKKLTRSLTLMTKKMMKSMMGSRITFWALTRKCQCPSILLSPQTATLLSREENLYKTWNQTAPFLRRRKQLTNLPDEQNQAKSRVKYFLSIFDKLNMVSKEKRESSFLARLIWSLRLRSKLRGSQLRQVIKSLELSGFEILIFSLSVLFLTWAGRDSLPRETLCWNTRPRDLGNSWDPPQFLVIDILITWGSLE